MKRSTIMLAILTCLMFSLEALASNVESFHKRFQIIRAKDGSLVGIRDRSLPVSFSVRPYVEMVKSHLLEEQALIDTDSLAPGMYDESVRELLAEEEESFLANGGTPTEFNQRVNEIVISLKELAALKTDEIFKNQKFNEVLSQYEVKMQNALLLLDPSMLANVKDSTFFYKKNTSYQAVTFGLNLAKKMLSEVPLLNTASYVVVQVEKMITERRNFHQNMLLHYLENYKEADLGLTPAEVNMIWSSIYESRIPWFAFWESKNAVANWDKYGVSSFYANFRVATNKLRANEVNYTAIGDRVNFAFQVVEYKNEKVIVNLFNNEHRFSKLPAVAYNYNRPKDVTRKRIMLNMAQLGLSFVTIPSIIKDQVDGFIKSFYVGQKITEGALYGYFESQKDAKGMQVLQKQYLNPFDTLAL